MFYKLLAIILLSLSCQLVLSAQDEATTNRYNLLVEEYFSYFEQNKIDSAEVVLRQALELIPDAESNFLLRGNLSELVLARRDTIQAISILSQAIGAQPDMHRMRQRRAELLAAMGYHHEALADLDYIVAQQPTSEVPRYRRALLYMDMGLWDGAKADLESIISHNNTAYLPRVTLAKVERERGDERAAERLLSYLIEKYPDTPVAYRERAQLYMLLNRKAEALQDIRTVIQKGKGVTAIDYQIRGDIWMMYGETVQAKKDYDTAERIKAGAVVPVEKRSN